MKLGTLEDLKHSRVFFDKKPPKFITYFVIFIVISLVAAIYFATTTTRNYVIKGNGSIEFSDKVAFSSKVSGTVKTLQKKEGEMVKKGELILTLSSGNEGVQSGEYSKQIEGLKAQLDAQDIYERSLKDKTNYLSNTGVQQAYYGKVENFLAQTGDTATTTYNQLMSELGAERIQVNIKKQELELQYNIQIISDEQLKIYAVGDGKVHYNNIIALGSTVLQGTQVGTIAGGDGSKLQVEAYIPASERVKVNVNSDVKLVVAGLSQTKYGTLSGKVLDIAISPQGKEQEATPNAAQGQQTQAPTQQASMYKVLIELQTQTLKHNNDVQHIFSGLQVEAQIIYNQETYLDWLLEQLNLKENK